ncbi:MAG: zinc ribbon domain-containing protein [Clostridia bacterium]|nr:zinc ribbon domain-containing protein [Clostridia bacterium]
MEFFDDAVNKTKEVFETVSKKTGEVIATEKQRFDMASLKTKREKDYTALGKLYFDLVKDDENAAEDVKVLVDAIKEKSSQIDKLAAQIQGAKNKLICSNCGAKIDNNSIYCNICGEKLGGEE